MEGWPVSDQPTAPERHPEVQPGHRSRLLRVTVVLSVIMAGLIVGGVVLGQLAKNPVSGASSSSHGAAQSASKESTAGDLGLKSLRGDLGRRQPPALPPLPSTPRCSPRVRV